MKDVLVPRALLRDPDGFGGLREGDCQRGTLRIVDGHAIGLQAGPPSDQPRMVIPKLVEAHCHLDKCHSIHRLGQVGGDLPHAIDLQRQDKANWSEADLRLRASQGLAEARAAGCVAVRTHVDWGDAVAPPVAWSVLCDLAADWEGLQCAPLVNIAQWADPEFAAAFARQTDPDYTVLGSFVRGQPEIEAGLRALFAIAMDTGVMLDFHVDEGLGDFNGLEVIADLAIETGFEAPILCGHAVSLMDRDADAFDRIADKLAEAKIAVCALPTTNLYLQGRRDGTPDRRGITRLRELRTRGVPVLVGSDNVGDAFCPMGQHDPMAALHLAALSAHLDPPMGDWLPAITTDAAHAIGRDPVHVDGAPLSDLLVTEAAHTATLVAGRIKPSEMTP